MASIELAEIWVYPVKSLGGFRVQEWPLASRGLAHDRRYMIGTPEGHFFTQRDLPHMALVQVALNEQGLHFTAQNHPELPPLQVPYTPQSSTMPVQVWTSQTLGQPYGPEVAQWFTQVLGTTCTLFYMPEEAARTPSEGYAFHDENITFVDNAPILAISRASLQYLNQKLEVPVQMDRFRPNFVLEGANPHAEDTWAQFTVGKLPFVSTKPCGRCKVTTINQTNAQVGAEPLKTLATYRRHVGRALFGIYWVHQALGTVKQGQKIKVQAYKEPVIDVEA